MNLEFSSVTARAYDTMRAVEDAHWWFDAMESITARLLDRPGARQPVRDLRHAGSGTGRSLGFLTRRHAGGGATVTGLDHSPVALGHCRARGFAWLARGSVERLPFAADTFDLVTSFDVLVAVRDDAAALREAARVLRPGGRLLVRVAAYDSLRARHDREWDVRRRYRRREMRVKLDAAGLRVLAASYANTWLFPVAVAKRWAEAVFPPQEEGSDLQIGAGRGAAAWALRTLLASEARWVAAGRLPFGLSLYALAEKPAD